LGFREESQPELWLKYQEVEEEEEEEFAEVQHIK
jgi:hypothetical protein